MNTPLGMALVLVSGLCWSAVYIDCIRTGFRQKTYCMPLVALALNISWEGLYAYFEVLGRGGVSLQGVANAVWFFLDIVILATYFRFAGNDCKTALERKWQTPFGVLALVLCLGLQVLFICEFGDAKAEIYSAYLQNIVMSAAYLNMLSKRQSAKGQTLLIAVCKCLGTLAPTLIGVIERNMFIVATGCACFALDVLYIYLLIKVRAGETPVKEERFP